MVKTSPANAGSMGSVLGWGAKILMAKKTEHKQQERFCNKFNKDLKMAHIKKRKRKNFLKKNGQFNNIFFAKVLILLLANYSLKGKETE